MFGTIVGHSVCTAVAVLGGRWLSTKISVKHGKLNCLRLVSFLLQRSMYAYYFDTPS